MNIKYFYSFVFICICQIYLSQSLNDDISFEKNDSDEYLYIQKVNKLLSESKIYVKKECSSALKDAFINKYACIDDYTIVYVYKNKPILIDQKKLSFIRAYSSNSTESTTVYITKSRIYVTGWDNNKFFGKEIILSQNGSSYNSSPNYNRPEIEELINNK